MENSKEGAQAEAVRCKMAWCGKPKRKSRPKHESESPGKHPLSSWPACVGFVRVQLCRLASTFWGDPARSLFEFYRAAIGEIPYRDFTLPYPPLAIALISPVLRWFGATFRVAQVTYDLLGFGCVFGVWFLARRLMPSMAAFLATLGFIFCGGGGALYVFHLRTYSPSNLVGFIGIVLSCAGLVDAIRGKFDHRTILPWGSVDFSVVWGVRMLPLVLLRGFFA